VNSATLSEILGRLSRAIHTRDLPGLMSQFCATPTATYAGSEFGEIATGGYALGQLFRELFARDDCYSFTFPQQSFREAAGVAWVLADGTGTEHRDNGELENFPYRITGVLVQECQTWKWELLAGSEPRPALSAPR
jgi:hypothetical protein